MIKIIQKFLLCSTLTFSFEANACYSKYNYDPEEFEQKENLKIFLNRYLDHDNIRKNLFEPGLEEKLKDFSEYFPQDNNLKKIYAIVCLEKKIFTRKKFLTQQECDDFNREIFEGLNTFAQVICMKEDLTQEEMTYFLCQILSNIKVKINTESLGHLLSDIFNTFENPQKNRKISFVINVFLEKVEKLFSDINSFNSVYLNDAIVLLLKSRISIAN